jgi:hypothetical protein
LCVRICIPQLKCLTVELAVISLCNSRSSENTDSVVTSHIINLKCIT